MRIAVAVAVGRRRRGVFRVFAPHLGSSARDVEDARRVASARGRARGRRRRVRSRDRSFDRSVDRVGAETKWRGAATSRFVPAFFLTTIAMKWLVCHLAVER